MYNTIYVPVDNSEHSNRAVAQAIRLGQAFESKMVGSHVYAATMHDYRFKQMEYTLPAEYLQEQEIERQRQIHDSLITMGLELISDCYLNSMNTACEAAELPLERRMMDGKHHVEILKDIEENEYDLTVMGVLGVGRTRDSQIGTVCEQVTRFASKDILVVKHLPEEDEVERDTILVGIDGSPQSFGALFSAIELAKKFDKHLELIGVYDPYLHYSVFKSIVDVLTDKAAKVFRFEEQNQLHEEIIDTGLAQIYQSHLNIAEAIAREQGLEDITKTLLDGKAFQKILNHARKVKPWLLVIGRSGVHSPVDHRVLGSNSENLLRMCPSDILLSTRLEYPELDLKAEESVLWTEEAESRMTRVPEMVRGIARTAILRLAIEQGHSVVTDSLIQEAMDRFMPKKTANLTTQVAEALALEYAKENPVSICKKCGVSARNANPVKCTVCGGTTFESVTSEMLEKIAENQGGIEEDVTYDGKALRWSKDARDDLNSIEDKYQKRRAKARIEKAARTRKLTVVTKEFAQEVIDDETGRTPSPSNGIEGSALNGVKPLTPHASDSDRRLIATDERGIEFRSIFSWNQEALTRILAVPSGFMREKTQERIEKIAIRAGVSEITMDFVEGGLEVGRKVMEEVVSAQGFDASNPPTEAAAGEGKKCPFESLMNATDAPDTELKEAYRVVRESYAKQPVQHNTIGNLVYDKEELDNASHYASGKREGKLASSVYAGVVPKALNEEGLMAEMDRKRLELQKEKN